MAAGFDGVPLACDDEVKGPLGRKTPGSDDPHPPTTDVLRCRGNNVTVQTIGHMKGRGNPGIFPSVF